MTPNELKMLKKKIKAYAEAMVAESWKGACEDPDDYEILCENLEHAEKDLNDYLESLK